MAGLTYKARLNGCSWTHL